MKGLLANKTENAMKCLRGEETTYILIKKDSREESKTEGRKKKEVKSKEDNKKNVMNYSGFAAFVDTEPRGYCLNYTSVGVRKSGEGKKAEDTRKNRPRELSRSASRHSLRKGK